MYEERKRRGERKRVREWRRIKKEKCRKKGSKTKGKIKRVIRRSNNVDSDNNRI